MGQPHLAVGHHRIDKQEAEHRKQERQAAQHQIAGAKQAVRGKQLQRQYVGGDGEAGTDEHGPQGQDHPVHGEGLGQRSILGRTPDVVEVLVDGRDQHQGHHYQGADADRSGVGGIGHEAVYVLLEHLAGGGHEVVIDELLHLLFQGLEHREGRHHAEHHGNHGHQGEQGHIGQVTGGDRQPVLLETAPDKLGEMGAIVAQEGDCVGQAAPDLLLHLDSRKRHHADIVSDRVPI